MSPLTLAISYFFHLMATIVWLGGLALLSLLVHPAARRTLQDHPAVYAFLTRLRKRFVPYANFSLAILITSGMFQMAGDENYLGALDFGNSWSVAMLLKHILVLAMVICSLTIQYGVAPQLDRVNLLIERGKAEHTAWEALHRRERQLTWLNNLLGVGVLAFTAWMTAL